MGREIHMYKHTTAIILAAGVGSRMESNLPKQYMELAGRPVLYHTIKAFQDSPLIEEIILVVGENQQDFSTKEIVNKYNFTKVTKVIVGGNERYHSVKNGLQNLSSETEYIMIHDGARPIVSEGLLERAYNSMEVSAASIAVMPVKDTIKKLDSKGEVIATPERNTLYMVQTPQVFTKKVITQAYVNLSLKQESASKTNQGAGNAPTITDDAMVVESFTDVKVNTFQGDYRNIKITTPEDIDLAELFLSTQNKNIK